MAARRRRPPPAPPRRRPPPPPAPRRIAIGSQHPAKVAAATAVLRQAFPHAQIIALTVDSGVRPAPTSAEETIQGALGRARRALEEAGGALGVWIEDGSEEEPPPPGGSGPAPPRAGPRRGRAGALRPGGGRNRGHHRVAHPPAGHPRGSPPPRRRRGAGTFSAWGRRMNTITIRRPPDQRSPASVRGLSWKAGRYGASFRDKCPMACRGHRCSVWRRGEKNGAKTPVLAP